MNPFPGPTFPGHILYVNTVLDIPDRAWDFLSQAPLPLPDFDLDGIPDVDDNCSTVANADQADLDGDCVGVACEHCADPDDVVLCPEPGVLLGGATAFATLGALHWLRRRVNA